MQLASGATIAALRVQSLLPAHIAEASDERMNQMDAAIAAQDAKVQRDLDGLRSLPALVEVADLEAITASWARFRELEARILALSRENTDVRALALSLNEKRKALVACQAASDALRAAIEAEPIAGVTYGRPVSPR
jgi:hypothetical protein